MELYKQAFLYVIEFHGHFDWWYFPFQLCSIPMYICLAAPLLHSEKALRRAATFLQDFGLLGGIMALAVPPGLMHPYLTMTLHGFIWHFILLFFRTFLLRDRHFPDIQTGLLEILPFFFLCCLIACVNQYSASPTADVTCSTYPHFIRLRSRFSTKSHARLVFSRGNLLYSVSMIAGGFLMHKISSRLL